MFLNSAQEKDKTHFMDQETGVELELEENIPLLEWLANNYKKFGAALEIITGAILSVVDLEIISFLFQIGARREAST